MKTPASLVDLRRGQPISKPAFKPFFNLDLFSYLPPERRLSTMLVYEPRPGGVDLLPFETHHGALAERTIRLRSLRAHSELCLLQGDIEAAAYITALIAAIRRSSGGYGFPNFVDPVFTRAFRNRFISHLIAAVESYGQPARCYTLVTEDWLLAIDELASFDPGRLFGALRAHLNRCGMAELEGFCVFGLHGEHKRPSGLIQVHVHLVAVGEKWRAIEGLREIGAFKGGADQIVRTPILCDDLVNMPRQLAYLVQGFFPSKSSYELPGVDDVIRSQRRRRIPEPAQGQYLHWLSRQSFPDLVWLHGIAVREGYLLPQGIERP